MLKLFNSMGKRMEKFVPVNPNPVNIFTCGPSVYQRPHIGNFRTFLFEDVLVRYLEYSGYRVRRGMNITDIEDKAIAQARKEKAGLEEIADRNTRLFLEEMDALGAKRPDVLPRATRSVEEAVRIIERLLDLGIAYRHKGDIFFDPLRFPGFGRLYGLDMSRWPRKKVRYRRDTYPGMRWNLGDFILWHKWKGGNEELWETRLGKGRPSWNVQDPSMINPHFHETLSIYCGGVDNLIRHHDYIIAVLESLHPYPVAKYWLHCRHLLVAGKKMSKSRGNIVYTEKLLRRGYSAAEVRFFLIDNHYRKEIDYSDESMTAAAARLAELRTAVGLVADRSGSEPPDPEAADRVRQAFSRSMDDDLDVRSAVDGVLGAMLAAPPEQIDPSEAGGMVQAAAEIDSVLKVIFSAAGEK
ncbi:MAG: class I tRNA ligase family protein [Syntrophales bacterium]